MSLGTSILLIAIFGGILYAIYKINQKRKWKLVLKISAVIVLLIVVISAGIWGYYWYQDRPHVASTLGKVSLGMSPVEVTLELGKPTEEIIDEENQKRYLYKDYSGLRYIIVFDQVDKASLICTEEYYYEIFGLGVYDSEEKIIKKLGEPTNVSINESGTSKFISYSQYKVAFDIEKGDVKTTCVTESGQVTFSNEYTE